MPQALRSAYAGQAAPAQAQRASCATSRPSSPTLETNPVACVPRSASRSLSAPRPCPTACARQASPKTTTPYLASPVSLDRSKAQPATGSVRRVLPAHTARPARWPHSRVRPTAPVPGRVLLSSTANVRPDTPKTCLWRACRAPAVRPARTTRYRTRRRASRARQAATSPSMPPTALRRARLAPAALLPLPRPSTSPPASATPALRARPAGRVHPAGRGRSRISLIMSTFRKTVFVRNAHATPTMTAWLQRLWGRAWNAPPTPPPVVDLEASTDASATPASFTATATILPHATAALQVRISPNPTRPPVCCAQPAPVPQALQPYHPRYAGRALTEASASCPAPSDASRAPAALGRT